MVRELFFAGEEGDFWQYSYNNYSNTKCHIKRNGELSRAFDEELGVRQGVIRSSDHYKTYVGPGLDTLDQSNLGYRIGPICVSVSPVADDLYLLSDKPGKLQQLLHLASHYGDRYRIKYGASKTKITVTGSNIDIDYYKSVKPWKMDGEVVDVVDNNDHLGLVVSGEREEEKNINTKLVKGRGSLFGLLGPALAQRCLLNPELKMHLFRLFTCPITRCGLSAMVIRPTLMEPLEVFHRKALRSFLSLSDRSPVPALYFIFGELPLSAKIHRDMFALFYGIWKNQQTKIHEIVKYLLQEAPDNSRTWSIYLRHLSKQYGLPDPLDLLNTEPMSKEVFKNMVMSKITAFHERNLRERAANNSKMGFMNVTTHGLRGRSHPILRDIVTTVDVKAARPVIKCLTSDYYTYAVRAAQTGGSSHCRICPDTTDVNREPEDIVHVVTRCAATEDIRHNMMVNIVTAVSATVVPIDLDSIVQDKSVLCQFLLDCTSLNLSNKTRVNINDPAVTEIFKQCRRLVAAIHAERMRLIKELEKRK